MCVSVSVSVGVNVGVRWKERRLEDEDAVLSWPRSIQIIEKQLFKLRGEKKCSEVNKLTFGSFDLIAGEQSKHSMELCRVFNQISALIADYLGLRAAITGNNGLQQNVTKNCISKSDFWWNHCYVMLPTS